MVSQQLPGPSGERLILPHLLWSSFLPQWNGFYYLTLWKLPPLGRGAGLGRDVAHFQSKKRLVQWQLMCFLYSELADRKALAVRSGMAMMLLFRTVCCLCNSAIQCNKKRIRGTHMVTKSWCPWVLLEVSEWHILQPSTSLQIFTHNS